MKIDSKAISGFFRKEERSVEEVYLATERLLRFVAFSVVQNEARAQEIAMETYLKAWDSTYSRDISFSAWLCSIARNLALDDKRKSSSYEEYEEKEAASTPYSSLWDELKGLLSPLEFDVLVEHACFDLRFREIAQIHDLPSPSSARGVYKRAKDKAKASLEEYRP